MTMRRAIKRFAALVCVFAGALFAGCSATMQRIAQVQHQTFDLAPGDLEEGGLAFLIPGTVTGQEEDRQPLALAFAAAVREQRPGLEVIGLSQTLSAINRAGLADEYQQALLLYEDTGAFDPETLRAIGEAVGVRYLAQLKMPDFRQGTRERFGVLGLSILQTPSANVRIYLQIWDSQDGDIAWEGQNELTISYETTSERTVAFAEIVREAARELVAHLP